MKNFFDYPRLSYDKEVFDTLLERGGVRIERIISSGQNTPEGCWLEQDMDEWVLLLEGASEIMFEDNGEIVSMGPGDSLHIEAHRRHRVERTDKEKITVWMAVHFNSGK